MLSKAPSIKGACNIGAIVLTLLDRPDYWLRSWGPHFWFGIVSSRAFIVLSFLFFDFLPLQKGGKI